MDDLSNKGSLSGLLTSAIKSYLLDVDDMLPCRVVSYDEKKNIVTVQSTVELVDSENKTTKRNEIRNIPVLRMGGGGFFMRSPIKAGDAGWIKASDRDISLVRQREWQDDKPNTKRIHSFSDGLFIPDTVKDWVIDCKNDDALVIQSLDGKSVLSIHQDKIELETETVKVISKVFDMESTDSATIKSPITTIKGNVHIKGTLTVDGASTLGGGGTVKGDLSVTGTSTAADHISGGVSGNSHTHSGVEAGGSNTASPNKG